MPYFPIAFPALFRAFEPNHDHDMISPCLHVSWPSLQASRNLPGTYRHADPDC